MPARAVIDFVEAMLITMRDADDVGRAWLYTARLETMRRTRWRMVHVAEDQHRRWRRARGPQPDDDYDVVEDW